jgi:putative transposase
LGIALSKFNRWSQRMGTPNQHNAIIPRDFWLEEWEKIVIVGTDHRKWSSFDHLE